MCVRGGGGLCSHGGCVCVCACTCRQSNRVACEIGCRVREVWGEKRSRFSGFSFYNSFVGFLRLGGCVMSKFRARI